jgi:hypothetical protein
VDEVTDEPLYRDRVCGIDIGKAGTAVTIRVPSDQEPSWRAAETRTFGTTRREVLALADWLRCWQVPAVVMESTGDYVRCEGAWVSSGRRCWRFGLGRRRSTRASARWPVSALACAVGNCGVRSPG